MKTASFPEMYARWKKTSWPRITGTPGPSAEIPKAPAQVKADQEWDSEGGSIKPAKAAPAAPKLPL